MARYEWLIENEKDGSLLSLVPAGEFLAGEDKIRLSLPDYYLALHPVTNAQYVRFLSSVCPKDRDLTNWIRLDKYCFVRKSASAYEVFDSKELHPVAQVSWFGARAYCKWANLRLPTELEWEKGSRGTDGRLYPWGNDGEKGRYCRCSWGEINRRARTCSVYEYADGCSPWGFYQVSGNVWEWCEDAHDHFAYDRYRRGDLCLPKASDAIDRVLRGSSWDEDYEWHSTCIFRHDDHPAFTHRTYGFRCARAPG